MRTGVGHEEVEFTQNTAHARPNSVIVLIGKGWQEGQDLKETSITS